MTSKPPRLRLRVLAEAARDTREARNWYRAVNPELAARFVEAIRAAGPMILAAPTRWREFVPGYRRYLVRGFPYAIIYTVEPEEVVIVAVAHHKRRPDFWLDRI